MLTITSTVFVYDTPDRLTSGVSQGLAIGSCYQVLNMLHLARETWTLISLGWVLIWDGNSYGYVL